MTHSANIKMVKFITYQQKLWRDVRRDYWLYIFLIPVLAYYILFRYVPMYGLQIAWKDFMLIDGIWNSPWVGWKHFDKLFNTRDFSMIIRNTLLLNIYSLLLGFPVPIVLALLFNEMRSAWYKRLTQQMIYIPHFFSWVVMGGMVIGVLSPSTGIINSIIKAFGGEPIYFMISTTWWPLVFVLSGIWKESGWGTIVYLAAISGVDQELYEAAYIDGANRWKQTWHITLPSIRPTIAIMLILRMGTMMDVGFEQVYILMTTPVRSVADVISTYVYRMGIENIYYSQTTALGLFQSVISCFLLISTNYASRKLTGSGIW